MLFRFYKSRPVINKTMAICIMLSSLCTGLVAQADATISQAFSFQDIFEKITEGGTVLDLSNTLIVMDDDDTLTMMPCPVPASPAGCQYLGGPAWFDWQLGLIARSKDDAETALLPGQVAGTNDGLFAIADLLLMLNKMDFADSTIPATLVDLTGLGAQLMVLTARDTESVSATQAQLRGLPINFSAPGQTMLDLIASNAPIWSESGTANMPGSETSPFCAAHAPVAYQNGIFFATGQNKGEMLGCFLSKSQSEDIEKIVFIDDTQSNVRDVYEVFGKSSGRYAVTAIHFTQLSEHKARFLSEAGPGTMNDYQKMATERWDAILSVLHLALIEPAGVE